MRRKWTRWSSFVDRKLSLFANQSSLNECRSVLIFPLSYFLVIFVLSELCKSSPCIPKLWMNSIKSGARAKIKWTIKKTFVALIIHTVWFTCFLFVVIFLTQAMTHEISFPITFQETSYTKWQYLLLQHQFSCGQNQ